MSESAAEVPVATVPSWVSQEDLNEALEPFYRLMGITNRDIYASPGITLEDKTVTFTLATHKTRGSSDVRVDVAQIGDVVVVGEGRTRETGIPVTVVVRG